MTRYCVEIGLHLPQLGGELCISLGKFLDLTMMLIPGGKERTEDEYRELYDKAGFDLVRTVPTSTEVSVIEGNRR